jgi:uncharacterized protein (TIGR03437 family)
MVKRYMLFATLLACLALHAQAQSVRVTWIGQSGFHIQSEGGPAVVSDPPSANFGFIFPTTPADVITISHTHGDHTGTAGVLGTPALVDGRNVTDRREVTAAGMTFTIIPGFHDTMGATRNALITWTQGGLRFVQGGDYGQAALTPEQLNDLRNIDVAFVAASTPTMLPPGAKAFIDQLRPRVAILCHYRMPLGGSTATLPFKDITAPYPNIVYKPHFVTLTRDNLPTTTEVWVMQPTANAVIVNSASFGGGVPTAPGSLASIFGNFTNAQTASAQSFPLPTTLGNVEVVVSGRAAPLLYVSPTQINFQVSGRLEVPGQVLAEIKVAGATVARGQVTALNGGPGLFVATDLNYQPLNNTPLKRGDAFIIFATGHGELTSPVEDGVPATAIATKEKPRVTLGGVEAEVLYSGLTPGLAGLWQINAVVPATAPLGANVPLVVTQGLASNALSLMIQASAAAEDIGVFVLRGLRRLVQ